MESINYSHLELYEGRMLNGEDWAQGVSLGCGLVYLVEVVFPMALKGPGRGLRGGLIAPGQGAQRLEERTEFHS